jgi:hypothetical protein
MAQKKKDTDQSTGVVAMAKTIGKAAGKIASLAGVHASPSPKTAGRLPKKNKSRLPRRQKKALQKANAGATPMM